MFFGNARKKGSQKATLAAAFLHSKRDFFCLAACFSIILVAGVDERTDMEPAKPASRGRVILKMSVQLPDGQKGVIHVFPGSNPQELAKQFCDKHGLTDAKLRRVVERHISENMRSLPASSDAPAPNGGRSSEAPPAMAADGSAWVRSAARRAERGIGHEEAAALAGHALGKVRAQALAWRTSSINSSLLYRCWSALVAERWAGRMRRYQEAANEKATAARAAEIAELHAANARIATLAFAQAGKTPEEAAGELREILEGSRGGGGDDEAAAARVQRQVQEAQLEASLASEARQVAEAAREVAEARAASAEAQMAQKQEASGRPGENGGMRAADADDGHELQVANAKIEELTQRVEELTAELADLTESLIAAKLGQAELANSSMALQQEKRILQRQLVVESVEMHEIDYVGSPPQNADGPFTRPKVQSRVSFPAGAGGARKAKGKQG